MGHKLFLSGSQACDGPSARAPGIELGESSVDSVDGIPNLQVLGHENLRKMGLLDLLLGFINIFIPNDSNDEKNLQVTFNDADYG